MDYDLWKRFKLFGNYTANDSRISQYSEDPTLVGKLLTYTPQNTFNFGYNWLNQYVNNQVAVQYVGRMYSDSTSTNGGVIDPHEATDAHKPRATTGGSPRRRKEGS